MMIWVKGEKRHTCEQINTISRVPSQERISFVGMIILAFGLSTQPSPYLCFQDTLLSVLPLQFCFPGKMPWQVTWDLMRTSSCALVTGSNYFIFKRDKHVQHLKKLPSERATVGWYVAMLLVNEAFILFSETFCRFLCTSFSGALFLEENTT